jgi:serine/threonine protein kinase
MTTQRRLSTVCYVCVFPMPFVTRRFAVGEFIAQKYLLLHLVGRGASGEVFRARNTLAGNILALKLLMEEAGRDSELVQRFFREARAINRIGHPNIVAVFDAGYADTIPYLAMEYLAGESLAQLLERKQRLSVPCAVAILRSVLDALAAAHAADVVHRDLKPANIYLQTTGSGIPTVKLLDFGVAKIHEEGDGSIRTESGMILGTPDYLSPEQITADTEVDGRSDLFAVGCVLFELLTGKRPFHGPNFVTTTFRIVHEPAPSLASAGGPDHSQLGDILLRALDKNRDGRYASAGDFARDLERICPDLDARESALRELGVKAPILADGPESELGNRFPPPANIQAKNAQESRPRSTPPARKLVRTWSDLPIVGRRRATTPVGGNVRGTVLLAIDRALTTRYGGDVREEIQACLPREARALFRELTSDRWCGLGPVGAFLQAANQVAVHDDRARWHALGYASVETDLLTLLRSVRNQGEGVAALKAALPILSGLFDFGRWSLDGEAGAMRLQATGFAQVPSCLRDWLGGAIEHAARSTGHPYRVSVVPLAGGAEDASVEFTVSLAAGRDRPE